MALFALLGVLSPRRRLYEPEAAGFQLRRTARTPHRKPLCGPRKNLRDFASDFYKMCSTCPGQKLLISELDTAIIYLKVVDGR